MTVMGWSINPAGEWSPRQAEVLLAALAEQATARGLRLVAEPIPYRPGQTSGPRVRIVVFCLAHGGPIAPDSCCDDCLRAASTPRPGLDARRPL